MLITRQGDKLTTRVSVRAPRGSPDETDLNPPQEKVDARRFTRPVYRERGPEW